MIRKILLLFLLVVIPASTVLSITADELYSRAAQKYLTGDLAGAEADLKRVLDFDASHDKARQLLNVVRREMGAAAPAVTTTTLTPRPAPTPPQRAVKPKPKPRRRFRPKKPKPEVSQPATREAAPPPKLLAPPPQPKFANLQQTINQIVLLILAVIIFALMIALRGTYFIIKDILAKKKMQTCPDCKTKNAENAEFCQVCGTRLKAWSGITTGQKKWFSKQGWKRNPFTLDVLPSLFTGYSAQVNAVMEKISTRSGHVLVYGEKGVGKTTLLRWLTDNLKKDNRAVYIARPPLNFDDMLRLIVAEIKGGLFGRRKKYSLYEIEGLVKKTKKPLVLLLDEAHEFTAEIEQQMRSLGDIQGVNYILAGLPETREKIKRDSPPFFDRIVLESYIDHLNLEETKDLIKKRIEDAGGRGTKPFSEAAIENIYKMSKGRPRMILKVCDWVMTDAIRNNIEVIGGEMGKDFPAQKPLEHTAEHEEEKS